MKNVLLRLRETQSAMSTTEQSIAKFICANPEECSRMSIRELAEKTWSSPSSVVRLCRYIGLDGYKDFRQELLLDVHSLGEPGFHKEAALDGTATIPELIDSITRRNIQCLEDTQYLLDPEDVAACVELIRKARNILLFGIGASLCVARDAYLKFLRVDKPCVLSDDWHSQLLQARNATAEDVGIVFSYSGQTAEMIECIQAMKESGTPVIAITRSAPSPVAKLADYRLHTATNEYTFRIGALSSRIAQLNVVDVLYAGFVNAEYEYCMKCFVRTHILKKTE